ncbi:hypothetical protein GCM10009087_53010 [Sphingomonas oligophenolica]|uniref:DUF4360 domain-containing protein n=1 Tax=Sphingomonas oligophenolica TaxID=301154 RepID=A0ABU9Y7G7_9SPHN
MRGSTVFATARVRPLLRRAIPLLALGALLSGTCSAATAQSWQCHAPQGTYDERDIDVPRAATQFTGAMTIHKAPGPGQWNPTATIAFNDLGLADSGCHCNGIVATLYPDNPASFLVSLSADGKETPLGLVPYDKPVKFNLTFTWDGKLRLEVGTGVVTGTSSTPLRNNLHLSCSTADVDFEVAVIPPVPPAPERCPFAAQEQWAQADVERYCKIGG